MGPMTYLGDVVRRLAMLDQDATIYAAQPWSSKSAAVVAMEPESGDVPEPAARMGLKYFLEVLVAREFIEDWESTLGRPPTDEERCDRLIRFAIDDA